MVFPLSITAINSSTSLGTRLLVKVTQISYHVSDIHCPQVTHHSDILSQLSMSLGGLAQVPHHTDILSQLSMSLRGLSQVPHHTDILPQVPFHSDILPQVPCHSDIASPSLHLGIIVIVLGVFVIVIVVFLIVRRVRPGLLRRLRVAANDER